MTAAGVVLTLDLARVAAPALVVSGGRDLDHFRNVAHHLGEAMARCRRVDLPWAAHLPNLERPQEVTEPLLEFLAE